MNCQACGVEITLQENEGTRVRTEINKYGGTVHRCDSIWCPKCQKKMLATKPCEHYLKYGYKPGTNQEFYIKLIRSNYEPNTRTRWDKNRSKSQYHGTLKNSVCKNCGKVFNKKDRIEQDRHEALCKKQTKLF